MKIKEIVAKLENVTEIKRRLRITKQDPENPITQDDLENTPMTIVGYRANCPAHPDTSRALVVNEVRNQDIQFHCSRGCTYGKIMQALGILDEEYVS